jgi:hypothetical protein
VPWLTGPPPLSFCLTCGNASLRLLSPFLLSLLGQCLFLMLAMCLLDGGHAATVWACACAVWNLALIGDWAVSKGRRLRHAPIMQVLPAWVSVAVPVLLLFPADWAVTYITSTYGS